MEPRRNMPEAAVEKINKLHNASAIPPGLEDGLREWVSYRDLTWARMDTPTQPMVVTVVLMLAAPLDEDRLKATLRSRLLSFARFRQRLVREGSHHVWVEDVSFDLDAHIQRVVLPIPTNQRALEERVGELASEPLDFRRPLWRCVIVDQGGPGCAVVFRVHHCIADGVALLRVFLTLTDRNPDLSAAMTARVVDVEERRAHARLAAKTAKTLVSSHHWLERLRWGAAFALALLRQMAIVPDTRTALRRRLNGRKRMAWSAPIPLADITAIRQRLGGRLNDVMLTAVTGALRRYLWARGEARPALTVRLAVPVNLRPYEEEIRLGNQFAVVFLGLPLGITDPVARLAAVQARTERVKSSPEAVANLMIISAVGWLPAWLERLALWLYGLKATAVVTNVPGPEEPLYLAGAPVGRVLAWVPQITGIGIGICVLSYAEAVTVGITSDSGVVADPWELVAGFEAEMAELKAGARTTRE